LKNMEEILAGIFLLTITLKGFSPSSMNTYLIRDTNGYTLIDTGWDVPQSIESMESQLSTAGIHFSTIKRVILTHCHSDHLGMMARFKQLNNASIYMHKNELDLMKVRYNKEQDYWPRTDLFLRSHGIPESELKPWDSGSTNPVLVPPDILLEGGEEIRVGNYLLKVINTPGHTPGHISLYEPSQKLLFSGDVLLPTIVTNAAGHIQHMINPLRQYLNSLKTLREMDIDRILPGHEYVFSGHRRRIDEIVEHYRQKYEAVKLVFENTRQPLTAYEVAKRLPWTPRLRTMTWDHLGGVDKRFAALQTIAILEELAFDKTLTRLVEKDKVYFQAR
jgi:glyoxylase-like metal-dependent hydrolase (beta-lactamase superfamily II)